jgi:uracil-DNA glycosylase
MARGAAAAEEIVQRIARAYPDATYALEWKTPWELLVGTILAGQSTDAVVNRVTPELFARYRNVRAFAQAEQGDVEELIRPCGIQQAKAKSLIGAARTIVDEFGGDVPRTMAEMLRLPGVKRKTANVVLNCAYGLASGIVVDTHVERVAPRIGLARAGTPDAIEKALMQVIPERAWPTFGPALILHGRQVCKAKKPACDDCVIEAHCERNGIDEPRRIADGADGTAMTDTPPKKKTAKTSLDIEPWTGPLPRLPGGWDAPLAPHLDTDWFRRLWAFVTAERKAHQVFPPEADVFAAFEYAPYDDVKLVLLGQDPYHDDDQAHGLCFSVRRGVAVPPSLRNMYKELHTDLGVAAPSHGNLEAWARQGALLLNAVLTVRAHTPNSHKDRGWERFTDAVIDALDAGPRPIVFALWGAYAQKKGQRIDRTRHRVVEAAHPSPLSAKKFLGSRPFTAIDDALRAAGHAPMRWDL